MEIVAGTSKIAVRDLMPWAVRIVELRVGPDGGDYIGFTTFSEYEAWEASRLP